MFAKDFERFSKAARLAENGEHRTRVGCVAVVGGKIVSGAFNTHRNSQNIVPYSFATYHAETNTLAGVPYEQLPRTVLYVARISKSGELLPSKPCWRCTEQIKRSGIKTVIYYDGLKLVKVKASKLTAVKKL